MRRGAKRRLHAGAREDLVPARFHHRCHVPGGTVNREVRSKPVRLLIATAR